MYAKIAAAGDDPAKIVFLYNRDTLFNDVSLMSNYMAKNLATKDGNALTDEYAISDDEKDLVNVSIRATLPDIYEAMTKITTAVGCYIAFGGMEPVKIIEDAPRRTSSVRHAHTGGESSF